MADRPPDHLHKLIGDDGFTRLVRAFYAQIPEDDILSPMYPPDDMQGAEERLRDFLIYRFGGSDKYIQERGHPRMRMRHAPFPITIAARDRWLELMNNAFNAAELPASAEQELRSFFEQFATFMVNRA